MKNKEILKIAIEKAENNGWDLNNLLYGLFEIDNEFQIETEGSFRDYPIKEIIFSHEFAKAFFGYEEICSLCLFPIGHPKQCLEWGQKDEAWRIHLQQMVLEKEPLKYLEKFL